ncbi:MAG: DoxX family protein [Parvibaculum sp.]|nr:DoxX family protein [Parvibaculum sp.]
MNPSFDIVTLVGRILLAALFILAGLDKAMGAEGTIGFIASKGLPLPEVVYGLTVLLELGGGILLLIGFQARLVGLAFALFCMATAAIFHLSLEDPALLKNLALAGGFLYVFAFGAGAYSLDAKRGKA